MKNIGEKPDYANWIPKHLVVKIGASAGAALVLFLLSFMFGGLITAVVRVVLLCATLVFCFFFFYMSHARRLLSYDGGGVQGKILDNVLRYLQWDGNGKLLDIGCGSGAMAIKAAKNFPNAQVTGIDYWGAEWDYAKEQCAQNARIEGVNERLTFQKGDASKLDFPDASFDAAVSNFVFHEVRSQPDKLALIREALRVIKPGGIFSFEDVFFSKSHYKDLDGLITALRKDVADLHFVDTRGSDFVPKFLKTPFVAGEMGLIYGRK